MKGRHQVPTQFKFFTSKHSLDFSVQNREAKERKKKEIDQIIEGLDKQNEILTEDSIQINQEIIEEQVRADTANLETMLYDKLDIRKASCQPDSYDRNLDEFLENELNPAFGVFNNIK